VGVVRISGTTTVAVATAVLGKLPQPRHATLAPFLDGKGRAIDRGIALFFPAPHSYTGEDVLELQGHGGPVVMQLILQRCVELGARVAQPGEFTKRAFLNEKLDLAQAEAVADLIEAATASAARSAMRSLSGRFSEEMRSLVQDLVGLRTLVEACLDFPEEDVDALGNEDSGARLEGLRAGVASLLDRGRQGRLMRSGLHVVLAGRPNVGKSSLLNLLAGEERAIVTSVAGTTRDALREAIQVQGIPLHIVDTAGLRETGDEVERIGVCRAWKEIEQADAVVLMADIREGITATDERIAAQLPRAASRLWVLNKSDLVGRAPLREETQRGVTLTLSAKTGEGLELLQQELLRMAGWHGGEEDAFLARERHLEALGRANGHLAAAAEHRPHAELLAEELRLAQEALNEITGEFSADDLLGEIFSRFCIGK
jgi:tRNA modification GTPase